MATHRIVLRPTQIPKKLLFSPRRRAIIECLKPTRQPKIKTKKNHLKRRKSQNKWCISIVDDTQRTRFVSKNITATAAKTKTTVMVSIILTRRKTRRQRPIIKAKAKRTRVDWKTEEKPPEPSQSLLNPEDKAEKPPSPNLSYLILSNNGWILPSWSIWDFRLDWPQRSHVGLCWNQSLDFVSVDDEPIIECPNRLKRRQVVMYWAIFTLAI